jgi:hypothetical protein
LYLFFLDYTKELFNQITKELINHQTPLEYYHIQEDEKESIIHIEEGEDIEEGEEENVKKECKDHNIFIKKFLFEEFNDFDDSNELLNKELSEIKDADLILCNNLGNKKNFFFLKLTVKLSYIIYYLT